MKFPKFALCPWLVLAVILMVSSGRSERPQTNSQYDYLFLIDCSGSMIGLPQGSGATVIFPEVAKDIKNFIDSIKDGANVSVIQFHRGLQGDFSKSSIDIQDRATLKDYVDSLQRSIQKNPGQVTWIYLSLNDALKRLKASHALSEQEGIQRVQTILLYTDGRDNGPQEVDGQRVNMDWIINRFRLQRSDQENLYLKYITLGIDLPAAEENLLSSTPGVEFIKQRGAVFETRSYNVEVRPTEVDFGNFEQADKAQCEVELTFNPELAQKYPDKPIKLTYDPPENLPASVSLSFAPQELHFGKNVNTLNLRILKTASEVMGIYRGSLRFHVDPFRDETEHKDVVINFTPDTLKYRFSSTPPLKVEIKAKDGLRLDKDFGKLPAAAAPAELVREFEFNYNIAAQKLAAPLNLFVSFSFKNTLIPLAPQDFKFQVDGIDRQAPITLKGTSSVKTIYKVPTGMKPGTYQGKVYIKADGAQVVGEGAIQESSNPNIYSLAFTFKIPWVFPGWAVGAIILLAVLAVLILGFLAYCRKRKRFPIGGYLSMTGADYYLENIGCIRSIFKKSITVGGSKSDIEMAGLQPETQFLIKPNDEDSLLVFAAGKSVLKNSIGDTVIKGEGATLAAEDFFEIEIAPDVFETVHFKKLVQ